MNQPPPRASLDDAFDKLRWAVKHFKTLREQVVPFEERDAHTISYEVDRDAGKYTFYVHGLDVADPDWGLIVGDCLHNARTALDYLVVRLFALATGEDPREIGNLQFPIYDDPGRFKSCTPVAEMRKHPTLSGYLARIEDLQPYNLGNVSIWGRPRQVETQTAIIAPAMPHPLPSALERLSILDNIDKHRVVHTSWVGVKTTQRFTEPSVLTPPAGFEETASSTYVGPLEDGAKVGDIEFRTPLPGEWEPEEMDMKRHFPLQVSLLDEWTFAQGVLEVLPFCLWGVEGVLRLFEPVFANGEPPLPVTAVPYPGKGGA